ncbi:MAG: 1-deoxy-D-xylulose-5-phosphate synthase [Moraxella sp.]|nr:1-deoxy-D-xylulose-5-phosphate synthase [Moraxella sp.]
MMSNSNHAQPFFAKQFDVLPKKRPDTPLLDTIDSPAALKGLTVDELRTLADEVREFLLYSVGQSGGHFGANLGVVELTIALHTVLNTPKDKLIWDVGHQAYAHKILTGRRDRLTSIRSKDGLTAFPERSESEYDTFGVGHSSTAISAGLGMSLAARYLGNDIKVACVVGDGAMTGGMAFEAMNDAVQQNADLLVILNDNDMSISQATGGFSKHLATLWQRGLAVDIDKAGNPIITKRTISSDDRRIRHYLHMANDAIGDLSARIPAKVAQKLSQGLPSPSDVAHLPEKLAGKLAENLFGDNLFRAIGFSYFGPFDGHDLAKLVQVFERVKQLKGAVLVHVHTIKGKGFLPAEADPIGYHAISKLPKEVPTPLAVLPSVKSPKKYSDVFGEFLCQKAAEDSRLLAITPAMCEGSGMVEFASKFPKRFFDVAIAEQHAVTLAAGMATMQEDGRYVKPVVAIYSTFLQRGYDQLIHDVALQNLDVTFAIDRAGLVGEDGATHAGVFDLAFMRCVPNIVIAAPSDENECYQLLNVCYEYQGVSAVRYPRGVGVGAHIAAFDPDSYPIGKAKMVKEFKGDNHTKVALLCFGTRLFDTISAAARLGDVADVCVVDMRWVKPLDKAVIDDLIAKKVTHMMTIEEHQLMGGVGSAVNEYMLQAHPAAMIRIKNVGIQDDFVVHASHSEQLAMCGLDSAGIYQHILTLIEI